MKEKRKKKKEKRKMGHRDTAKQGNRKKERGEERE